MADDPFVCWGAQMESWKMSDDDKAIHIHGDHARAAHSTGHMRYVLGIGLGTAIFAMSLAWIIPAMFG